MMNFQTFLSGLTKIAQMYGIFKTEKLQCPKSRKFFLKVSKLQFWPNLKGQNVNFEEI